MPAPLGQSHGRYINTAGPRMQQQAPAEARQLLWRPLHQDAPGRSSSASLTNRACMLSTCGRNAKMPTRKLQTKKLSRWNTFCVVQPYSGTRRWILTSWTCKATFTAMRSSGVGGRDSAHQRDTARHKIAGDLAPAVPPLTSATKPTSPYAHAMPKFAYSWTSGSCSACCHLRATTQRQHAGGLFCTPWRACGRPATPPRFTQPAPIR